MGKLRVMDHTGDHEVTWDPEDEASVAGAEEAFRDAQSQGHAAFVIPGNRLTKEFDKNAEQIVTRPPFSGG